MKLDALFPKEDPCMPLIVDIWARSDGYRIAVPKMCPNHEWRMIGPGLMMRLVGSRDTSCSTCDACNAENCPSCFKAIAEDRLIHVEIRRCIVDKEQ